MRDSTKSNLLLIAVLFFGIAIYGLGYFSHQTSPLKLVAECPAVNPPAQVTQVLQEEIVRMPDGWTCDAPKSDSGSATDLMQPSGYWNMDLVNCFKLVTPISKWCAEHPDAPCTEDQKSGKEDPKI